MQTKHALGLAAFGSAAILFAAGAALTAQSPELPLVDQTATDGGQCTNATQWRGSGAVVACTCPAGLHDSGSVWGSGIYTDDSNICSAARHAGVLRAGQGGTVIFQAVGGRSSYSGSTRNGISSSNYGSWSGSFRFVRAAAVAAPAVWDAGVCGTASAWRGQSGHITCSCDGGITNSASVWGTDEYTDDSNICKAAVHAGAITRAGGRVTIELTPGRSSFAGSTRRGMTTSSYGSWGGGFRFVD